MRAFIYEHTGNMPTAKDVVPKILWLKEERPDLWERTRWLLDCKEYILFKLTGVGGHRLARSQRVLPVRPLQEDLGRGGVRPARHPGGEAATGLSFDPGDRRSDPGGGRADRPAAGHAGGDLRRRCGGGAIRLGGKPGRQGPPLHRHRHLGRRLEQDAAQRPRERPSGRSTTSTRTSGSSPARWRPAAERCSGTATSSASRKPAGPRSGASPPIRSWTRWRPPRRPGSDGLFFTPWLSGERAPVLDHYLRGGFLGLSLGHTRAHLTRSVMEGVAFHIRWIIEAMEELGFRIEAMQAIGGGSVSPVWTQIIADVTARRLKVVEHPLEAGAMGAALAVAVGLGHLSEHGCGGRADQGEACGRAAGGRPGDLRAHVPDVSPALPGAGPDLQIQRAGRLEGGIRHAAPSEPAPARLSWCRRRR